MLRFRSHIRTRFLSFLAAIAVAPFLPLRYPSDASAESVSALPAVYIETGGTIEDTYRSGTVTVRDASGTDDITDAAVSVRLRGNSSRRIPKKSYKLHFEQKANPLGLGDGKAKTWALLGNGFDASLLRNWTAMQIAEKCSGLPYTPNCRSVELYLDGKYSGVYLLIETVSINKNRINIAEEQDAVEENGYLLEMTRYAEDPCFYAGCFKFEIKNDLSADAEIAEQQKAYISDYTEAALHALRSGDAAAAAQYIDIDSLVDNCLVNEIYKNVDCGWDSYFLYKDADGKLTFGPVWDFDCAFGNCTLPGFFFQPEGESIYALSDAVASSNPWICYAMQCGWFRELLKARFDAMLPELQSVPQAIVSEAEAHTDAYEANYTRISNLNSLFLPFPDSSEPYYTQAAQAQILAGWLERRLAWLDAFYHSPEYDAGMFPDDEGNVMPLDNEIAVTLISQKDQRVVQSELSRSVRVYDETRIFAVPELMLAKGQTYRLTFDYSCTGSVEFSCVFSGQEEQTAALSAVNAASPDTQTAEFIFTPAQTDVSVTLYIYGNGSGSVSASGLKLEKIAGIPVFGDLNGDGLCSSADVHLLQKWLLGEPAEIANPQAADTNADGRLDARDLTLLKRHLPAATDQAGE